MTDAEETLPAKLERRVRALEAFGHRGSGTGNERRAAEYLAEELTALGLQPQLERFSGSSSAGARLLLHVVLSAAGLLALWWLPALTVVLCTVALVTFITEQHLRVITVGRPLARSPSQNVVARVAARAKPRRRLVLCAHVDTQRTGLMWREGLLRRLVPLLSRSPGMTKSPMFPILAALALAPAVGLAALIWPGAWLPSRAAVALLVVLGVSALILGEWARGPFVPGACDNASGAASVLSCAERWLATPLADDVELVVVLTGCEEVGLFGAKAWVDGQRSAQQQLPVAAVNIDSVGYGAVRYIGREHSLAGLPERYLPGMLDCCRAAAAALELADAGPHVLPVASDALPFIRAGIPVATILSFEDDGHMPNYHQPMDTADRMDFAVTEQGVELAWEICRQLLATDRGRAVWDAATRS